MRNYYFFIIILILSVYQSNAQVGIGTSSPNSSSILDVVSENKGILIPRISKESRNAMNVNESENSLLIFNTDSKCYNFWNGNEWLDLCGAIPGIEYTIDCTKTKPGPTLSNLTPNKELDENDYVEVTLNVTNPGPIQLISTINNGYYFEYSGTISTTGEHKIRLTGNGIPNKPNIVNNFKISGPQTCSFQATVGALSTRTLQVLFLASSAVYLPANTSAAGHSNMALLLNNPLLFGNDGTNNGIVSGFKNIQITTQLINSDAGKSSAASALRAGTYDIVIIGWESNAYNAARQDLTNAIREFLSMDKKAGLFLYTQDSQVYAQITNQILTGDSDGSTVTGLQGARATSTTVNGKIENTNHIIINGPFGDLRGLPYTSMDDGLYLNFTVDTHLARENKAYSISNGNNIVQTVAFIPKNFPNNSVATAAFNFSNNLNDNGGGDLGIFAGPNFFNCASVSATGCLYSNMNQSGQGDQTKINTAFNLNILAYLINKIL